MSFMDLNHVFVKEKISFLFNTYEFYSEDGVLVGSAKEQNNFLNKIMQKSVIEFFDESDNLLFRLVKPFAFFKQHAELYDSNGVLIGKFIKKLISFKPQYYIFDQNNVEIGLLKGDFLSWNFTAYDNNNAQLMKVDKKWNTVKEMFTTADNYQVTIQNSDLFDKRILFACPIVVDIIHNERKR
ncbi:hypothetical protein GQ473_01870 [archaeon]|nr:hypothetical protein [archaeon]